MKHSLDYNSSPHCIGCDNSDEIYRIAILRTSNWTGL